MYIMFRENHSLSEKAAKLHTISCKVTHPSWLQTSKTISFSCWTYLSTEKLCRVDGLLLLFSITPPDCRASRCSNACLTLILVFFLCCCRSDFEELFDVIITNALKPGFFSLVPQQRPFRTLGESCVHQHRLNSSLLQHLPCYYCTKIQFSLQDQIG